MHRGSPPTIPALPKRHLRDRAKTWPTKASGWLALRLGESSSLSQPAPSSRSVRVTDAAFPGCDRLTIGPGNDPCEVTDVGVAAHIYAAAASGRGPRGDRALSEDELRSADNAIWLCAAPCMC